MANMSESDAHVIEYIRLWVWSGFYAQSEVEAMIEDLLEEDTDEALVRAAVAPEFARKRKAEAGWPAETDCDRLDRVFYRLHEQGVCALHNAGYTMSEGYSEVAEAVAQAPAGHYHGYCFYHGQDVERAVDGEGLMLAFGDLEDRDVEGLAVGRAVAKALADAGFEVAWNESVETRLSLALDWRRRGPPNISEPESIPAPPHPEVSRSSEPAKPKASMFKTSGSITSATGLAAAPAKSGTPASLVITTLATESAAPPPKSGEPASPAVRALAPKSPWWKFW